VSQTLGSLIAGLSRIIDDDPRNAARDPEARTWGRIAKIGEEFGEVIEAYIGATAQNPRKGQTHSIDDVRQELFDVALTAFAAWEHLSGNRGESINAFVEFAVTKNNRLADELSRRGVAG
jgi:NTP pyrophosphatase (non-canonical NTP hydrolase)